METYLEETGNICQYDYITSDKAKNNCYHYNILLSPNNAGNSALLTLEKYFNNGKN